MTPPDKQIEVLRLTTGDAPAVADVLCEAFRDYPVMRYVLGASGDYEHRLQLLVGYFVDARVYRNEILLGIRKDDLLVGAALVSRPDSETPPEMIDAREQLWLGLGSDARRRYETFGGAVGSVDLPEPHIHLNMIGVRESEQGRGLGRVLLEAVHELSVGDPESLGVSLTTEIDANVPLYEYFGYREVGRREVGGAFTTHVFFRTDE